MWQVTKQNINTCAIIILTQFNVVAWRVDQVRMFGCLDLHKDVEEIEYFVLFGLVLFSFSCGVFWLYQFAYGDTSNDTFEKLDQCYST